MKKYILKKDLPFAKAGTGVKIVFNANYSYDLVTIPNQHLSGEQTIKINKDETENWVEEVKPREWNLIVSPGRPNIAFENIHLAMYEADEIKDNPVEIVKVREVIE